MVSNLQSKHGNEEQCQIIPYYASGSAVQTQLSWLFLWLFLIIPLIIPNYSMINIDYC